MAAGLLRSRPARRHISAYRSGKSSYESTKSVIRSWNSCRFSFFDHFTLAPAPPAPPSSSSPSPSAPPRPGDAAPAALEDALDALADAPETPEEDLEARG